MIFLFPLSGGKKKMESSLYSCIQAIQDGDKEQALAFLEKFSPLLKKYAYFLQTEDALQELQCFLLAFVKIYISISWLQAPMVLSLAISIRRYIIIISHFRRATETKFQRCPSRTSQTSIRCSLILTLVSLIHTQISCWWIFNVHWQLTNTMSSMITFSVNIAFRRSLQEIRNLVRP